MRAVAFATLVALCATACSEVYPFECDGPDECMIDGEQGVCTAYDLCAFPDPTCPAPEMLRYDESAGELADVCVGEEEDF
jgi:hypothetical protein